MALWSIHHIQNQLYFPTVEERFFYLGHNLNLNQIVLKMIPNQRFSVLNVHSNLFPWWTDQNSVSHLWCHIIQFVAKKCNPHIIYVDTTLCVSQLVQFNNILWGCVAYVICMSHAVYVYTLIFGYCIPVWMFPSLPYYAIHTGHILEATMHHHFTRESESRIGKIWERKITMKSC